MTIWDAIRSFRGRTRHAIAAFQGAAQDLDCYCGKCQDVDRPNCDKSMRAQS